MIYEVSADPTHLGRIARGETVIDIRPDVGFEPDNMISWTAEGDRHAAAHILTVQRAADFPHGMLSPGLCVLTFELYRTWIADQPGPGDWSEPELVSPSA